MKDGSEIVGEYFGRLIVQSRLLSDEPNKKRFELICRCYCGNVETILEKNLKNGSKTACIECTPKGNMFSHLKLPKKTNGKNWMQYPKYLADMALLIRKVEKLAYRPNTEASCYKIRVLIKQWNIKNNE